jgi:hypothetical protein
LLACSTALRNSTLFTSETMSKLGMAATQACSSLTV